MVTTTDLKTTPQANVAWIDPLIHENNYCLWNLLVPARQVLYYTFSITSGTESQEYGGKGGALQAFNSSQMTAVRNILSYVTQLTGITFSETAEGSVADLHFAATDISGSNTTGVTATYGGWSYNASGVVTSYNPDAYVYLDNHEFASQNQTLQAGNTGYETLLHEIGHALGLKHPFESDSVLSAALDNTSNTVMSYTEKGGPYSTFQQLDLAALTFLYGKDGLGGSWGWGSSGKYYQGTNGADTFSAGNSGTRIWSGQAGQDSLGYTVGSDAVTFSRSGSSLHLSGSGLEDLVANDIEILTFTNQSLVNSALYKMIPANGSLSYDASGGQNLNGTTGTDARIYTGNYQSYSIAKSGNTVTVASGNTTDTLTGIERLYFDDQAVALDSSGIGGQAYRIYQAAFDRKPDTGGVGYWIRMMDEGTSLETVASSFVASNEFKTLYGASPSNTTMVNAFYQNVLHRAPDSGGFQYWLNELDTHHQTAYQMLVNFSESTENQNNVIGTISNGFTYDFYSG